MPATQGGETGAPLLAPAFFGPLFPQRFASRSLTMNQQVEAPRLSSQLSHPSGELKVFFFPNSLPVGGFSRVSREPVVVFAGHRPRKPDVYKLVRKTMKDPPTQAVENTSPLQKTPDMLRSRAAANTGMASQAKCIQPH